MSNEDMVVRIQRGDREVILELWGQVESLVRRKADRWLMTSGTRGMNGAEADDLYQAGFLALLDAVETFDSEAGKTFVGWLDYYLKAAFSKTCGLRTVRGRNDPMQRAVRLEAPLREDGADSVYVGDIIQDDSAEDAFREIEDSDRARRLHHAVMSALDALTDTERSVIVDRFYKRKTLKEISMESPATIWQVRNIESRALKKLRHAQNNKEIRKHLDM